MGLSWAEHQIEIAATPEQCFEAITDYETMPKWLGAVLDTKVLETDRKSKLGELVELEVDGKVRKIRYTLRYKYDRPKHITWDFVEGHGIKQLDGEWRFEQQDGGTLATYKTGIDPGAGVPGPVAKRVNKQTIKRANEDLKAEAERRARKSGAPAPSSEGPATAERFVTGEDRRGDSPIPYDMLPEPLEGLARLPGRILVRVGKLLGG